MAAYLDYLQSEGFSKYEEARKLSEEESKKDPDNNPYKSKYLAREILVDIKKKLENYDSDSDDGKDKDLVIKLAALQFHLGLNYLDTEELSSGEEHMTKCYESLQECRMDKWCVSLNVSALNQLGVLWCSRREHKKALEFLMEAKDLHEKYKHEVGGVPYSVHETLQVVSEEASPSQREKDFEKIHTHTLYYLAQVYGQLNEPTKSASYCHTTLKRQLESSQYEPIDWSLNCATLSQYYITQDNFTQARHCLASASRIFSEANADEAPSDDDDKSDNWTTATTAEHLQHRKADIARCWAKYGLALLQYSKDKKEEPGVQGASAEGQDNEGEDGQDVGKLTERFSSLELTSLENAITDKVITSFEQGREVFLAAQRWLNEAKEYYVLDGHVSDHIEITKDHSQLYKLLSYFEMDLTRRCQMHKRRVDMLQAELTELNPQHFLLVCRQLQYEIAETYSEMMDLKMQIADNTGADPTPHAAKKINQLIKQSLSYYQLFLDSLKDQNKKMPEKLENDVLRPAMVAYFCMARLHSKVITLDLQMGLSCMSQSLELYGKVVDYCTKHPESIQRVEAEYELCKEMVDLLPVRMDRLRSNMVQ